MDKKEFNARLAQYCEYHTVTPRLLRNEDRLDDEVHEVLYDGDRIQIERTHNPTLGIELQGLKTPERECELGCGQMVKNQVVQRMLNFTPVRHWRTKCGACGMYEHPNGEELIDGSGGTIASVFSMWYSKRRIIKRIARQDPK